MTGEQARLVPEQMAAVLLAGLARTAVLDEALVVEARTAWERGGPGRTFGDDLPAVARRVAGARLLVDRAGAEEPTAAGHGDGRPGRAGALVLGCVVSPVLLVP